MTRSALALLALVAAAPAAASEDTYHDLPGVRDPATMQERPLDVTCTTQLERQRPTRYRNGLAYRTYSCTYGKVRVGSDEQPDMIEYRKYRQRYD